MKQNQDLRKALALILAMFMLAFSGCSHSAPESVGSSEGSGEPAKTEKQTVAVCMDMDIGHEGQSTSLLKDIIRDCVPEFMESYELEIESVPGTGSDREPALDRIRVEMMAGEGPDLFLCVSPRAADPELMPPRERETGLFPYPRAMMKRKMFLPLDEYIEGAEYMEWDKLYPEIMAAGKNDEGQQILPISWSMDFTRFDAESYTPPEGLPMSFDEMLESNDPGIKYAILYSGFGGSLGMLADYENDAPAFTEEELMAQLEGHRENREHRTMELSESLGHPSEVTLGRLNASLFTQYDPDSVLIPQYNRDGGATANITTFGAVNINTKAPEGAFRILDVLMSKEVQRDSELLSMDKGAPVHMELLGSEEKVNAPFERDNGKTVPRWWLSDYNYDRLQELIKQINAVDFVTPVHHELTELYRTYMQAETPEEREKLAGKAYTEIKMMLAES